MRGKRGLNHVHVGSLHAADDEMALRHARDVYTRRNEGVSIWVVRSDAHRRLEPGREGPAVRPERRQGLPAPDVLRDPRQRPPHVSRLPVHHARGRARQRLRRARRGPGRRAAGRSAPSFDDPLAGVDTTVPDGRRRAATSAAYCLMLGDDALVLAQRLAEWMHPRARARGGRRARQHRARPARPGPAAAGPRRLRPTRSVVPALPDGSPVPDEDALAFFRDADEFRNVAPRRGRQRRLRGDDRPAAAVRRPARLAAARAAARARRDPVLAAIAAKGVKELTYHRDYAAPLVRSRWPRAPTSRAAGCRPGLTRSGRCIAELFAATESSDGWPRRAWRSTRPTSATRWPACSTQVLERRRRCRVPAGRPTVAGAQGATGGTPRRWPAARRDAGRRPRAPEGRVVTTR